MAKKRSQRTSRARRFIVVNPDDDLLFNCDTQTVYFSSQKAIEQAINEDLDEPQCMDEAGKVFTARVDGARPWQYVVYERRS